MLPFAAFDLFAKAFAVVFLIGLLWILLYYFPVYKKLAEEKVEETETASLVLGIVQPLFGGTVSGILPYRCIYEDKGCNQKQESGQSGITAESDAVIKSLNPVLNFNIMRN